MVLTESPLSLGLYVLSAEVKKAYNLIQQVDRRNVCIRTIENATERVLKDRRARVKKGARESELGDLQDAVDKEVLRAFAEIENRRLNLEKREAAQRKREAEQQEKEAEAVRLMAFDRLTCESL